MYKLRFSLSEDPVTWPLSHSIFQHRAKYLKWLSCLHIDPTILGIHKTSFSSHIWPIKTPNYGRNETKPFTWQISLFMMPKRYRGTCRIHKKKFWYMLLGSITSKCPDNPRFRSPSNSCSCTTTWHTTFHLVNCSTNYSVPGLPWIPPPSHECDGALDLPSQVSDLYYPKNTCWNHGLERRVWLRAP